MKRLLLAACLCLVSLASTPALAGNWMFQRSYYSHRPATNVRIGGRAAGGPYYSRHQGAYVNSGYRWLHSTITVGGRQSDNLNVFESWVQTGEQY